MTTRYNAILVSLEREIREDDINCLLEAIACLRGVLQAIPVAESSGYAHEAAKQQALHELKTQLREVLWPKF